RRLSQAQPGIRCKAIRARKRYAHDVQPRTNFYSLECARIERQPQTERCDVNTLPKRIERLNIYPVAVHTDISAIRLPAKLSMFDYVGRGIEGMAEEIWPIVASVRIPLQS